MTITLKVSLSPSSSILPYAYPNTPSGSNLGLNIKKPDTENGKVIIFNGIDGVRKVARAMLTSDTKHIHSSGLEMSPA
jgi:hypothetical protein